MNSERRFLELLLSYCRTIRRGTRDPELARSAAEWESKVMEKLESPAAAVTPSEPQPQSS